MAIMPMVFSPPAGVASWIRRRVNCCGTEDNRRALAEGRWHCHESCWTDASRLSIDRGEPVDIACRGGLRLHAVPIFAGDEIVGSINCGYSDPPRDPDALRELAKLYEVSFDELQHLAGTYQTRPPFIVELAKKRLRSSARLIGEIVRRRTLERRQQESEHQYRMLFAGNPNPMWVYDLETLAFLAVNDAAIDHYGYSRDEFLAMTIKDIRPPECVDGLLQNVAAVTEGMDKAGVWLHLLKDGRIIEVEITSHTLIFSNRRAELVLAYDVTQRNTIAAQLHENEERLRLALLAAEQGLYDVNMQTHTAVVSPEYARMLGYDPDDFQETDAAWRDRLHPDDREQAIHAFQKFVEGKNDDYRLEFRQRTKSGDWKWILSVGKIMKRDQDGKPLRILGTHTDITEHKNIEAERLEMERRLLHTQKLESLGVLAGGIAHDFNNLLMVILGNADLSLLEISPVSPARPKIDEIIKATHRAADLCRQMLAYSGKGAFVIEHMDVSEVVREMIHMLKTSISKKVLLNLNLEKNVPPIEGDPAQIRQVIMNLVINGSEAIGDKSGVVSVSTGAKYCEKAYLQGTFHEDTLTEGLYVTVEVSDTGCGMDRETQARIFEPFFTTKFTGRGLGLSAVLGIIRSHKGAMKVYSEPGKGTTFRLLFPVSALLGESKLENSVGVGTAWRGSGTVLTCR